MRSRTFKTSFAAILTSSSFAFAFSAFLIASASASFKSLNVSSSLFPFSGVTNVPYSFAVRVVGGIVVAVVGGDGDLGVRGGDSLLICKSIS